MDYSSLGLTTSLIPINSPLNKYRTDYGNSYLFDSTYERNTVGNSKIVGVSAEKIIAGTVDVAINLGTATTGYVRLDGANNRIIVNDGTTNRIVIGEV